MRMIVTKLNKNNALAGLPFFFRVACNAAGSIRYGAVIFTLPDGRELAFLGEQETESAAHIIVKDFAFARRTILGGDIGFFESYADGQWETPDLAQCLYVFARNAAHIPDLIAGSAVVGFVNNFRHFLNRNTRHGSRRNIVAHYDLGNSFYERWLDPSMTYSSARFAPAEADLETAQLNKYRSLANRIDLKPDDTVLEIGSGWGGFAEYAARHGAKVTGLTLSPSQLEYARERIFKAGLSERVEFRLQDYRDVDEKFDKIASIEMFEAVGREYWTTYFDKVRSTLKPGGAAGLQIITIADQFFDHYSRSTDFIQRYVFPGGMLPSPSILKEKISEAGLEWRKHIEFGEDYARTLSQWRQSFLDAWQDIKPMGFDERFKKLWQYYLAYCEAGFRAGTTNVSQIVATRS